MINSSPSNTIFDEQEFKERLDTLEDKVDKLYYGNDVLKLTKSYILNSANMNAIGNPSHVSVLPIPTEHYQRMVISYTLYTGDKNSVSTDKSFEITFGGSNTMLCYFYGSSSSQIYDNFILMNTEYRYYHPSDGSNDIYWPNYGQDQVLVEYLNYGELKFTSTRNPTNMSLAKGDVYFFDIPIIIKFY